MVIVIPPFAEGRSETELNVQRANTKAFIDANPILLTLYPQELVKTGGGTRYSALPARPAQKARLIDQTRTFGAQPGRLTAGDGAQRIITYQLLMEWDALIARDDYWIDADGIRWNVLDLLPNNGYERRAEVNRHGES
jgi:hypothetical protein